MVIHIDLETFSSVDLKKYGMHKYVESPDFEILMMAYAIDDEPVQILDFFEYDERMEAEELVLEWFQSKDTKMAHNASFEIACLTKFFSLKADLHDWYCTAVHAAELGLPRGLGELSTVLNMPQDKAKMGIGRGLISYFCKPCKPSKVNGGRTRNYPWHDPVKWELFKQYCKNDVEAEREAHRKMSRFPVPESEWMYWRLDQTINNRGMRVDLEFVDRAIEIDEEMRKRLIAEAKHLTKLSNPNSLKQLISWLNKNMDEEVETLKKDDVKDLLKITDDETVSRVLQIRQELAKTSVKKYAALQGATCSDERIRGTLLFYGAARTGRDAGRVFQPQNLPQNHLADLEGARWLVKYSDIDTVEMIYESISDTLSQLIRTAIVPAVGKKFIIADYSAVEARGLAWMANEQWRIDVFKTHGKIYEASASTAFHVPMESITKTSPLRQQGKVLELACGYGGSVGAIDSMDKNKAIPENERKPMVDAWRKASPNIVSFWWQMGAAAIEATENPGVRIDVEKGVYFKREGGFLFMGLPSGRRLAYPKPMMQEGKYGPQLTYEGLDQKINKWTRISTYGPKLVENLIQAICRDLLFHGVAELEKEGYPVILRVHDEVVVEVDESVTIEEVCKVFERKPKWAETMPHRADGFEATFYKKD